MAIAVREDIRERVRVEKVSVACVFVVDASGSMGATKRWNRQGAVLSMLFDSYQHRIASGLWRLGDGAEVVLRSARASISRRNALRISPQEGERRLPPA